MPCCKAATSVELRLKGSPTSNLCWAIATNNPDTLGLLPHLIPRRRAIASSCSLVPGGTERVSASFFRDISQNTLAHFLNMCHCRFIVSTDYIKLQADNHDSLHYPAQTRVLPPRRLHQALPYLRPGTGSRSIKSKPTKHCKTQPLMLSSIQR